jgi:hypothetical protein
MIDLHTHTCWSDGADSPEELVANARAAGVSVLGLTDHDTLDGLAATAEAAAAAGIAFWPGVEISTSLPLDGDRRLPIHLLGYGVDPDHAELQSVLAGHARARVFRIGQMLEKVNRLIAEREGIAEAISPGRVLAIAGTGSVGRPHLARALVEAGYARDINDVFARFIGRDAPAYVRRAAVDTEASIRLLRRAGGVPVLAHPAEYEDRLPLDELYPRLAAAGLLGAEADYGDYAAASRDRLRATAHRHGLIATGGSDYHGLAVKPDRPLGCAPVPLDAVEALAVAAARARAEAADARWFG